MKFVKFTLVWLISLVLAACGGGGGNGGNSLFNVGGATNPPMAALIDVSASASQLGANGDEVTITAVVKGSGNVGIANAPVVFSSDSGNLISAATTTDATGVATATLSAGANKTNRNIKVTVASGDASGFVVVPVVSNTTAASAATSIDVLSSAVQLGSRGDQVTITAIVKGTGNVSLANTPVSFSADSGTLTSVASATNATGLATAVLSAGSNQTSRNITVVVTSGNVSGSIVIPVVGSTSSTTSTATSIDLLSSSVQLGSGGDQIVISAIVKGTGNVSLSNTPVSFSADSGILTAPSTLTDSTGTATATLSAGSNKSNRDIKVTVVSGSINSSITIPVTGTTLSYAGATTVPLGESTTVVVKALDSKGAVIPNMPISIASSLGNGLSANSVVTSVQGTGSVTYSATRSGTDTLNFSGAGTTTTATVRISAEDFAFTSPSANAQIAVNTSRMITVRYLSGNIPQADKEVSFAVTAGTVSPASARTNANGIATAVVTASTAGPALVQATLASGIAQASVPVEFVAITPAKLVLQITPTALAPNPVGATAQQAQAVATVTDTKGNPVKGVTVNFNRTEDSSAGNLNQASAVTDSSGQASVQYIAGALTTASNGVKLRATVASNTSIYGDATLTVNQSALFIALGTGNVISNVDPQTYKKDWVVYVTDSNGIAVPNINLTIKVLPLKYLKGNLTFNGTKWVYASNVIECDNEDAGTLSTSFNGILDAGEDFNGNGVLDPGNVITVTTTTASSSASAGTIRTDGTGRATISLIYAESYAPWVKVRLRAEAVVSGTESSKESVFIVEGSSEDFSSVNNPPAGVASPFGTNGCSVPS
jgi:hypothetical protein